MTNQLTGHIDRCFLIPAPGEREYLFAEGWILNPQQALRSLTCIPKDLQPFTVNLTERKDVQTMLPKVPHAHRSGFCVLVPKTEALYLRATLLDGNTAEVSIPLQKKAPSGDPLISLFLHLRSKDDFLSIAENFLSLVLQTDRTIPFPAPADPECSIIIPVHNRAAYTALVLWSLARQTKRNFEIIVVDNRSSDETSLLLQKCTNVQVLRNESNLHYLAGCNQGAAKAHSANILFCNNDCVLHPAALEMTLPHLQDPNVGIIGGLILNPPGVIQEAGCRVLSDGSTIGIYRFKDPLDAGPGGDVDYCSGAFLATKKDLFTSHGGFHPGYSPAYGEDADYGLAVQAAGKRVICETKAIIIHREHGSSEHADQVQPLIERSKEILRQRHASFFEWPFIQKTQSPHLLLIDDLVPDATLGQGLPRAALVLETCLKHFSHITCIATTAVDTPPLSKKLHERVSCITSLPRSRLSDFIEEYGSSFSAILVSRPSNMEPLVKTKFPKDVPLLYDAESVFAFREITKRALTHQTLYSPLEIKHIVSQETAFAANATVVLAVSESEAQHFTAHNIKNVEVLSHGVAAQAEAAPTGRAGILTVSPIVDGESPNFDGNQWFIREILPQLKSILNAPTSFAIAGAIRPSLAAFFEHPDILLAGIVPKLEAYYEKTRVFVAPTRFGAGIPLKVIEASAYGLPSVVTPLVAQQLGWQEGEEILVGRSPRDFAEKTALLLTDDLLWNKISTQALSRAKEDYSRERFTAKLAQILSGLGFPILDR